MPCLLIALIFLFGCATQRPVETVTKITIDKAAIDERLTEKEQAMQFSLKVVESYFTLDCNFYLSAWDTPWISLENYQIINISFSELSEVDKSLACEEMKKYVKTDEHWGAPPRGTYSFQDFLEKYNSSVYVFEEYIVLYPRLDRWEDNKSYLFVAKPKEGIQEFVWDDTLFFMVKKISNKWKIVATY